MNDIHKSCHKIENFKLTYSQIQKTMLDYYANPSRIFRGQNTVIRRSSPTSCDCFRNYTVKLEHKYAV